MKHAASGSLARAAGMRKAFAAFLAASLIVVAYFASNGASSTFTHKDVTIHVSARTVDQVALDPLVQLYQSQNPGVTVSVTYSPVDQYGLLLRTQLAAGTGPDVMVTSLGHAEAQGVLNLAQGNYLYNLATEPWAKRVVKKALPLISVGKKIYAWPMSVTLQFLAYNKDIFKKFNITPPTRFVDLLKDCKTLSAAGTVPIAYAGGSSVENTILATTIASSDVYAKSPNWDVDHAAGKVKFATTPGWGRVVVQIQEMIKAGCFSPGAAGITSFGASQTPFNNGSAAMTLSTPLLLSQTAVANPQLNYGTFELPALVPSSTQVTFVVSPMVSVNANSSVRADAVKFVDFLARANQVGQFAQLSGNITPDAFNHGTPPASLSTFSSYFKADKTALSAIWYWPNANVQTALDNGVQGLFTGQKKPVDILRDMDAAYGNGTP